MHVYGTLGNSQLSGDFLIGSAARRRSMAFDENGIKFAFPTVQVAGETETANVAVAQHAWS